MRVIHGYRTCTIIVLQNIGGMVCWRMKIEWNFNEIIPSHWKKKKKQENLNFFRSFASRRTSQGQIFHSILIGFISLVAEASLGDSDLSWIFGDAAIDDCVAPLRSTIFEFMDCVEIVLDVDKPLGARW